MKKCNAYVLFVEDKECVSTHTQTRPLQLQRTELGLLLLKSTLTTFIIRVYVCEYMRTQMFMMAINLFPRHAFGIHILPAGNSWEHILKLQDILSLFTPI